MGRKSRRKAKFRAAGKLAPRAPVGPAYPNKPTLATKAAASPVAPAISSAQANRYQYIMPELRLIGIISGALFIILFILAFILS